MQWIEFYLRNQRWVDTQYRDLLEKIMREGKLVNSQQEMKAKMIFGHQMRFDLRNGIPVCTERDISGLLPGGIGEMCGFLNGARTLEQLESFGCKWWDRWATPSKCAKRELEAGDLGPGSYGAAWTDFPTCEGDGFNQITHLVEQIREFPHLRTHIVTPFVPQYLGRGKGKTQKVVVVPCHGFLHVLVDPEAGELSLHHFQRSADVPVGLVFNMVQYSLLTLMLAAVTGYKAKELVYTLSDAHIFECQFEDVKRLLARPSLPYPTVEMTWRKEVVEYRAGDFQLQNYYAHGKMSIATPV